MNSKLPGRPAIDTWARLARAYLALHGRIEAGLKAEGLPPLAWYDVLIEVHRAREAGLRQFEIGKKTLLTKYNLSRLLDRLERENLLKRQVCAEDGRGNVVVITPEGTELLRRMWAVYGGEIQVGLEAALTPRQLATLGSLLGRLLDSLNEEIL